MTKWKQWGIVLVVAFVVTIPGAWVLAKNSDAYAEAERFLRGSSVVAANIGAIASVSLSPLGYTIRFSGPQGYASFEVDVIAAKGSGIAYIELEKRGIWEVRAARLVIPGKPVVEVKGT